MQASIVIITTAAGKLQDDTKNNSLDNAVTIWLVYAIISVIISGGLLIASWTNYLPAASLSQVAPRMLPAEVERLSEIRGLPPVLDETKDDDDMSIKDAVKEREKLLKSPVSGHDRLHWLYLIASVGIIFVGWAMFGLGVSWGVHGSVVAGTTGE